MDISEISKKQQELMGAMEKLDDRMMDAEGAIQKLFGAFPSGDVDGHRRYHELIIAQTEEYRQLKVAVKEKTVSSLIWTAILGLFALLWTGFRHYIGK